MRNGEGRRAWQPRPRSALGRRYVVTTNKGPVVTATVIDSKGSVFNNTGAIAGDPNTAAIKAIFTNGGAALNLDVTGQDLQGLALILLDLRNLTVDSSGKLGGPTP